MAVAIVQTLAGAEGGVGVDDQVDVVGSADGKPGAREVEGRPGDLFQTENVTVEPARAFEVGHAESDVVEGFDLHIRMAYPFGQKAVRLKTWKGEYPPDSILRHGSLRGELPEDGRIWLRYFGRMV